MPHTPPYGFVVLAAGQSSRLGQPKALLPYRNTILAGHIVAQLQPVASSPIVVVTGADAHAIEGTLQSPHVHFAYNAYWKEGIASSVRTGLAAAMALSPQMQGVIFLTCDQPFVTARLMRRLMLCHRETGKPIIASAYADTLGAPILFDPAYFDSLLNIRGEIGTKSLLRLFGHDVATVAFAPGATNIDTPHDYGMLLATPAL
jgi:molybdenum cofactor cytidylyltransferase